MLRLRGKNAGMYKVEELKEQGSINNWMRVRLVFSESVFRYSGMLSIRQT